MTPEDAILAVKYGVDAIVVSNHGGRQLDEASSMIEVLPAIRAALSEASSEPEEEPKDRIPVIVYGDVRSEADVFKALSLGADFVHVGRPVLWCLGYNGQEGVETVCDILEREFSRIMTLAGITRVQNIGKEYIVLKQIGRFGVSRL